MIVNTRPRADNKTKILHVTRMFDFSNENLIVRDSRIGLRGSRLIAIGWFIKIINH